MGKNEVVTVTLVKEYDVIKGNIRIKKGAKLEVIPRVEDALERDGFIENRERKAE